MGRTMSRGWLIAALFAAVCGAPRVARADPCKVTSVGGISFGNYDPLSPAMTSSMASLGYSCPPGQGGPQISIDEGTWGTFAARKMKNAADPVLLSYNIYKDAGCQVVWGDGSNGTVVVTGPPGQTQTIPVFGCLPPNQDVAAGTFTDTVVVTFNF